MIYLEAIQSLQDNKVYPLKVRKDLRSGDILGIEVDWSPIMRDAGIAKIKDILGDGFDVSWFGNDNNFILITLKNDK